ncbi:Uncharacterised protein [Vibrio cholerae]|nr:Uncharacterised protein [Vibrio cholerae]
MKLSAVNKPRSQFQHRACVTCSNNLALLRLPISCRKRPIPTFASTMRNIRYRPHRNC